MQRFRSATLFLTAFGVLASCSSDPAPPVDAAIDTGLDTAVTDLGTDMTSDIARDTTDDTSSAGDAGDAAHADGATDATADGAMDAGSDATHADDAAVDGASDALTDAGSDAARDVVVGDVSGRFAVPRTFQDDYLPEFHIDLTPADLALLLPMGSTARVPMTLRYMGMSYTGTIRQRLGNNSTCGDLRQFRIDFPSHITLPDGYRTDRFETDRGRCYVMHEWLSQRVLRRAATAHPELPLTFKYTNVVAIYFNDALYHLETLTEDTNRDLMERFEGTRNVTLLEGGCYTPPETGPFHTFCNTYDLPTLRPMFDFETFLLFAAVSKALVPGDNYPDVPYNWVLARNDDRGVFRPVADDWDEVPATEPMPDASPFVPAHPEGDFQRHFTALLADPTYGALYRRYLNDARAAMDPAVMNPLIAAKYTQIRPLLMRVTGNPFSLERYDFIYTEEVPRYFTNRYNFLGTLPP